MRVPSTSARERVRSIASAPAAAGFRPAAAALAVAAAFAVQPAQAQPAGGTAVSGSFTTQTQGNTFIVNTVNGAGNRSVINWQSFSVPGGTVTDFRQPSATSTSINRVTGGTRSDIFGTLTSNGNLVLVNPTGIAFGPNAMVDTAGFTASTLALSESDAVAGRLRFQGGSSAIQVGDGARILAHAGDVVLVGSQVQVDRNAVVQANGAAILAAGEKVEITGRGLEGIALEVQAGNQAVNLGTLKGDAVGIFAGTLKHSGLVQAQAVTAEGGKVVLKSIAGDTLVDGTVVASAADGKGGSVDVLGNRVGLLAGAVVDASGANGGGSIRIGGDYQGKNADVPNAQGTYVDAQASIRADATQQGDGGRVIVWSDGTTTFNGRISARGGATGGNGGFAEVSGRQKLEFTGRADLRATGGTMGTLLLDPNDVEIVASPAPSPAPGVTYVDASTLSSQLETASVIVQAGSGTPTTTGGNIRVLADVTWQTGAPAPTPAPPSTLGLQADNGIDIQANLHGGTGTSLSLQALGGNITQSPSSVIQVPYVVASTGTAGASITLNGANLVDTVAGATNNGAFSFTNAQSLTIGTVATAYQSQRSGIDAGAGDISVTTSAGDLIVAAPAPAPSPAPAPVSALVGNNVSLQAAGNVTLQGGIQAANLAKVKAVLGQIYVPSGSWVNGFTTSLDAGTSITLGGSMGATGAGSSISLTSRAGSIVINPGASVSGGSVTLDAQGSAGDIKIDGVTVASNSGDLTLTAARDILVGTIDGNGAGSAASTSLSAAGKLTLAATRNVQTSEPSASIVYGSNAYLYGGSGGVSVSSQSGDVDFGQNTWINTSSSPVAVSAGGSVLGSVTINTNGSADPTGVAAAVSMTAGGGISFNTISATAGEGVGLNGGNVSLSAGADVSGSSISTSGMSNSGGDGGNAGNVGITAGGSITLTSGISASGGSSFPISSTPAPIPATVGGSAASVNLNAGTGVSVDSIDVTGGSGATPAAGGSVTITTRSGNISVFSVSATGGANTSTDGGSTATGATGGNVSITAPGNLTVGYVYAYGGGSDTGTGGQGGVIRLAAGGSVIGAPSECSSCTPYLSAYGGMGGTDPGSGNGMAGGRGGSVQVNATAGDLVADSGWYIDAAGGQGGAADTNIPTAVGGIGGTGGDIQFVATGRVRLASPLLYALGGDGGLAADDSTRAASGANGTFRAQATGVDVVSSLTLGADWINDSVVNLAANTSAQVIGTFQNNNQVQLNDGAVFFTGNDFINAGKLGVVGGGSATVGTVDYASTGAQMRNTSTGVIDVPAGSNLLAVGFLSNDGIVNVDGTLGVMAVPPSPPPSSSLLVAAATTGTVFVNQATGVLSGKGTLMVDNGSGTVDNFGTISPGGNGAIGTLSLNANLLMEAGSTLAADLLNTSSFDTVVVSGALTTGGTVAANYQAGAAFSAGDTFRLMQSSALDPASTLPAVNKPELRAQVSGNDLLVVANTGYPPPPPAPAPAPAPGADAAGAQQVTNNQVVTFAELFVQMSDQQQKEADDRRIGKDNIVVTDTACTR